MVTVKEGILTTQNVGSGSTQANRVLVDYKDALQDYRVTELPVISMFAENFTTETGGDIDITFAKQSMVMEQIEEGTTPKFQHTDMRNERVNVKEWGIAVGVTRRMIEDSRFSEVELALNEARRAVDRHVTSHFVKALFGIGDATFGTGVLVSGTRTTIGEGVTSADTEAEISAVERHPSEVCVMVLLWTCTSSPAQSGTVQGWHIRNAAIHARARQLVPSRGPLACAVRSSGLHPAVVPPLKGEL